MFSFFVLLTLVVSSRGASPVENELRRPLDEFTPTGKRVAEWVKHQIGNPEELGDRFEGDIDESPENATSKNGIIGERYRWPRGQIPYVISGPFTSQDIAYILQAFAVYASFTCIRFRPRVASDSDFINIRNTPDGCYSRVGRDGGQQFVNLQSPGCTSGIGTPLHELMHTIGFYHEHSRTDRDDWVTIHWRNIVSGQEDNFVKYNSNHVTGFGTQYDYYSIMHYSWNAFSIDTRNKATITAKRGNVILGQRNFLTSNDARKINLMYRCGRKN